ncbi:MAG: hypothetical protein IPK87_16005 [Planctomycetes bacterium]|nr:hypothetical protein [Planctomycetota bacterium]
MRLTLPLLTLLLTAAPMWAGTVLSVVPLAKALQNPDLAGVDPLQARADVLAFLVNQPANGAEAGRLHERLAQLATHRGTRLGKLFFQALETLPAIEQVPEAATEVELLAHRPLELQAVVRIHVTWQRQEQDWKISRFDVGLEGAGAAPIAAAAPYFGNGAPNLAILDAPELDYLVGRDVLTRNEVDPAPFDYDAGLADQLNVEEGAYATVMQKLRKEVTARADRAARIAALKPHMSAAAAKGMESADADEALRDAFWKEVFAQLVRSEKAPQPAGMPTARGTKLRITALGQGGAELAIVSVTRLPSGEIGPLFKVGDDDAPKGD